MDVGQMGSWGWRPTPHEEKETRKVLKTEYASRQIRQMAIRRGVRLHVPSLDMGGRHGLSFVVEVQA